jgi:hypothetical protein
MAFKQAYEDVNNGVAKIGLQVLARMQEQMDVRASRAKYNVMTIISCRVFKLIVYCQQ